VQIIAVVANATIAPGVQALSGRVPTTRYPDVFVRSPVECAIVVGLGLGGISVAVGGETVDVGGGGVDVDGTAVSVGAIGAIRVGESVAVVSVVGATVAVPHPASAGTVRRMITSLSQDR
jgi:hypothetical protein